MLGSGVCALSGSYHRHMTRSALTATPVERDVVIAEGPDARSYLQTQLTQDVERLGIGESAWSFILDAKSSIEALVRVTRTEAERVVLDVEPGLGDGVRQRLDGLLFRTEVSFSQATWPGVSWRGDGAHQVASEAPIAAAMPWKDVEGLDIVGPMVVLPDDADVLDSDGFEDLRIEAGWPSMGSEITEGTTPAMAGIVDDTVSFEKGCYTGQELVARVYHRGADPVSSLVRVAGVGSVGFTVGDEMSVDGASVGSITSVASTGMKALGFVKRGTAVPGTVEVPTGSVEISRP